MVNVTQNAVISELIDQKIYYIESKNKNYLLMDFLRKNEVFSSIIFTKTRKTAEKLFEYLTESEFQCDRIHSDRSQQARNTILEDFRDEKLSILIATDIAARGIDISHITHVFNYELPQTPETYVHRIGRTGRAGKSGTAITLCTPDEKSMLGEIQKSIKKCIPVVEKHTYANIELTKALLAADNKTTGLKEKNRYKGSKANGDFYRRQKRESRNKK